MTTATQPAHPTFIGSDPVILPLYNANRACIACPLRSGCLGPVPGIGLAESDVMFVGESPGEGEDYTQACADQQHLRKTCERVSYRRL